MVMRERVINTPILNM